MQKVECPPVKVHYAMIRDNEREIVAKLDRALGFYRIYFEKNIKGLEIIYDTPNLLLSNAGIVLSKQFESGKCFFKVRKLSYLPTELRRPSEKFYLSECKGSEMPKDYPLQIASAINNAFSNVFKIDLVEVVKQTVPIYEILVKGRLYSLTSGSGMKGQLVFEDNCYKDLVHNKKVKTKGATITMPGENKKEISEVLDGVDRRCKELLRYEESRFEIAQRLLLSREKAEKEKKMAQKTKKTKEKKKKNENNENVEE